MNQSYAPRAAALAAFEGLAVRPTSSVGYVSQGRVLMVGASVQIEAVLPRLPDTLAPFLLLADAISPALAAAGLPYRDGWGQPKLEGWLGAFRVEGLSTPSTLGGYPATALEEGRAGIARYHFDLVLDLSVPPALDLAVPPPGYFAATGDADRLETVVQQLADLVGEFDKPKFFNYRPEICAHHTASVRGCQSCVEVCGAAAIRPGKGRVEVNPNLCQGCGDCTAACPSGALGYAYPRLGDSLERLRLMLSAWRNAGGGSVALLLHGGDGGRQAVEGMDLPEWLLPYPLEALGAAGMDLWLSALAYGAAAVWLLDDGGLSRLTLDNLRRQMGYANALLDAMGYGAEGVRLVPPLFQGGRGDLSALNAGANAGSPVAFPSCAGGEAGCGGAGRMAAPASHAGQDDKCSALRLALEHLYRHAPQQPQAVALAEGAPYGQVAVDGSRCTLCMACVSVCPVGALQDGREQPQLRFIEANCVQCGRCADACPEDAVALLPRYLFDSGLVRQSRVLHQADVFHCVECGKPFASAAMIQTISAKLKQHPMFQGDAARRLLMCEDCRVDALFRKL